MVMLDVLSELDPERLCMEVELVVIAITEVGLLPDV